MLRSIGLALLAGLVPAMASAQISNFTGSYSGTGDNGTAITWILSESSDGVDLEWSLDDFKAAEKFMPDPDGPGYVAVKSGFLGMFEEAATSNPLQGDPVIWLRVEDDQLNYYRMIIDAKGHFSLHQLIVRKTTGELDFSANISGHAQPSRNITASLQPR